MVEILESVKLILGSQADKLVHYFNGPEGALQALAIAGFIIIVLLFVVAQRRANVIKGSVAVGEPVVLSEPVNNSEISLDIPKVEVGNDAQLDALSAVATKKDLQERANEPKSGTNVDGFVFHRRKGKISKSTTKINDEDPEIALAAIEQEMLATRELYLDGVISKEVYIKETRHLYEKAQPKM